MTDDSSDFRGEVPDAEDLVFLDSGIGVNSGETKRTGLSFFLPRFDIEANYGQKEGWLHVKKVAASSVNHRQKCSRTTQCENSRGNLREWTAKKTKQKRR